MRGGVVLHTSVGGVDRINLGRGQAGSTLNGAAAKVISFDGLGKKVRPGTCGKIQVG